MSKPRVVKLFLSVETVPYRTRDYQQGLMPSDRPTRYRATWVSRGTQSDLYKSKLCSTKEEAVQLARKYLARLNAPVGPNFEAVYGTRTVYVDTTDQPERFGYSHDSHGAP